MINAGKALRVARDSKVNLAIYKKIEPEMKVINAGKINLAIYKKIEPEIKVINACKALRVATQK